MYLSCQSLSYQCAVTDIQGVWDIRWTRSKREKYFVFISMGKKIIGNLDVFVPSLWMSLYWRQITKQSELRDREELEEREMREWEVCVVKGDVLVILIGWNIQQIILYSPLGLPFWIYLARLPMSLSGINTCWGLIGSKSVYNLHILPVSMIFNAKSAVALHRHYTTFDALSLKNKYKQIQ